MRRGDERGPVGLAAARAMSGDEHHALRVIAMRDRNADRRGRRDPRRDAVDDFHFDARRVQRLLFFAAAAEHERIAAFQTRDAAPGPHMLEHLRDDAGLRRRRMPAAFADVDDQRVGARELAARRDSPDRRPARRRLARARGSALSVISSTSPGPAPISQARVIAACMARAMA